MSVFNVTPSVFYNTVESIILGNKTWMPRIVVLSWCFSIGYWVTWGFKRETKSLERSNGVKMAEDENDDQ